MKKNLIFGLLIFAILGVIIMIDNPVGAQNDKATQIAYVDMQQLFANHPDKAASEEKLNEEAKRLQKELEEEAKNMTKEERQEVLEKYQQQLNTLERDLVAEVMKDINDRIIKIAKDKGITVVVEKPVVIYGGYDLTDEVLASLTATEKTEDNTEE
ncbi:periplasmic chaperone for outer membrane proteins Skp [Orenia metallireducens]|uniref:Periplasmic chaperone for outer membrane proteins Skp n=1 Tax=Orenia metallireducens TaxID=1413210 RepID=A0A285GLE6_9FIRM|nr:OmpH family outer membrane protein [Orenia metallireducens]PRX35741.1 periplasmic chaperone for outer membrane proteins Skp [Orenia metallireducens]SNY24258.1 periplasmic chaperone for outer membrane proteins Skp [Orenia metallireducens]